MLLREGELPAGEIAQQLGMSPPATLTPPAKVKKPRALSLSARKKNFIFYELNTSFFEELLLWIKQFQSNPGGTP